MAVLSTEHRVFRYFCAMTWGTDEFSYKVNLNLELYDPVASWFRLAGAESSARFHNGDFCN